MIGKTLWLFRPRPQPDELLSSWIVRTSWENVERIQSFSSKHFESRILQTDLDRYFSQALLNQFSDKSGLPIQQIFSHSLVAFEGTLFEFYTPAHKLPWIVPLQRRGRLHKGYSLAYCALCLANDDKPYFRRFWRLAFAVACPSHRVRLQDRCKSCDAPVAFHQVDFRATIRDIGMTRCHRCRHDLIRDPPSIEPELQDVVDLVTIMYELLFGEQAAPQMTPVGMVSPLMFFVGVRVLLRHITSTSREARVGLLYENMELSGKPLERAMPFEALAFDQRLSALQELILLLKNWPSGFLNACEAASLSSSYFRYYRDSGELPFWLATALYWHRFQGRYQATQTERDAIVEYLSRTGQSVAAQNVRRWLGKRY